MSPAFGIDFGTSNSSVAMARDKDIALLSVQDGATSIPTALFFSFEDNTLTFGREAVARYMSHEPGRFVRAIKSLLGSSLFEEQTQIRFQSYSFSTMITDFLRFLRERGAEETGETLDRIVLGRPVYFVDDDPTADALAQQQLHQAALDAGFTTVEFQFEPIAAALNYEQTVTREEIALVVDIGGGTSDFSVLRVSPDRARKTDRRDDILSFDGIHIGGTDFDRWLSLQSLMPVLGYRSPLKMKAMEIPSWYFIDLATWHRVNTLYEPKIANGLKSLRREAIEPEKIDRLLSIMTQRKGHELLARIEAAKVELTSAPTASVGLPDIETDLHLPITRTTFEQTVADGLEQVARRAAATIAKAGLAPTAIETIFLTGGSSAIPALQRAMLRIAPQANLISGDAFGSVASGLALDARRRFA